MGLRADHHAGVRVSPTCSSAGSAPARAPRRSGSSSRAPAKIVALRPDITPQIARVVATRLAEIPGPIRLCYEGAVTRLAGRSGPARDPAGGHRARSMRREPDGDAEVLAVAAAALARIGLARDPARRRARRAGAFVLDAAPDPRRARSSRTRSRARIAQGCARRRACCPKASRHSPRRSSTLWGPARRDARRARGAAVARAGEGGARRAARGARGVRRARRRRRRRSPSISATCAASTTTPAFGSPATRAARPMRCLRGGRYDELIARYGRAAQATGFAIDLEAVAQAQRVDRRSRHRRAALGVATHGAERRSSRARCARPGLRAVTQRALARVGARGCAARASMRALVGEQLIADSTTIHRPAKAAIEAARAGDTAALIALLQAT